MKALSKSLVLLLVVVSVLSACSQKSSDTSGTSAPENKSTPQSTSQENPASTTDATNAKKVIGLVQIDLTNPFHIGEVEGAKEAARRNGFELKVASGEGDVNKQIQAFENLVEQKVDAIAVNCIDISAFGPAFDKAKAANIPVVSLHSKSDKAVAMLGFDEYATGQSVGEYAVTLLKQKNGSEKGKVAVLQGLLGQGLNESRTGGFTDVMGKYPDIEVVAKDPTNWDPKKATEITENWLVAHPDLDMIYGLSDSLTVPAANVVKRSGKKITIVSVDGADVGLKAVKDGDLASTFLYAPQYSGYWKVELPFEIAMGKDVPEEYLIKGILVTQENVDTALKLNSDMKNDIQNFPFEKTLPEIFDSYAQK